MTTPNDPNPQDPSPGDGPQPSYGSTPSYGSNAPEPPPGSAAPAYGAPAYEAPAAPQASNGLAIASLVLGILGIVTCWLFFGVPGMVFGLIGLILGIQARKKVRRGEAGQAGVAKAGFITSIIALVLGVVGLIATIAGIGFLANQAPECDSTTMSQEEYQQCLQEELGG